MFATHNAGRMCGDILLAECSSAFSGLWCRRTALGGEPSRRLDCRCTGAPRILHSDLIRLRMYEDISLSECSSAFSGLWCRWTALGGEPSGRLGCRCTGAPRIPHSDLRNPVCELYRPGGRWNSRVSRPCGRSDSRRCAVWILGVVPSGLSPHGVASICTLGWCSGDPGRNGLQSVRVPAPHLFLTSSGAPCALTPRG